MKRLVLASAGLMAMAHGAMAYGISTSETLPPRSSFVTPVASSGLVFSATTDLTFGTIQYAKAPFDGVAGYEGAEYFFVPGGASATFTRADNPTFVTGGDTFSFILGSPDSFNSLSFSNGLTIGGGFGTPAAGYDYEVVTVSGVGAYDSVTFASSRNSLEFVPYAVTSVPLPAALPLFGLSLLAMAGVAYARNRTRVASAR